MDVLTKALDAASMFWQALDERERMLVLYAAGWVALMVLAAARQRDRENLKRELRAELVGVAPDGS